MYQSAKSAVHLLWIIRTERESIAIIVQPIICRDTKFKNVLIVVKNMLYRRTHVKFVVKLAIAMKEKESTKSVNIGIGIKFVHSANMREIKEICAFFTTKTPYFRGFTGYFVQFTQTNPFIYMSGG